MPTVSTLVPSPADRQNRLALVQRAAGRGGVERLFRGDAARGPKVPGIRASDAAPPVAIPPGHVGPVVLPGTGRVVYWTGRVAIGLRHEPARPEDAFVPQSALWVQNLMLTPGRAA